MCVVCLFLFKWSFLEAFHSWLKSSSFWWSLVRSSLFLNPFTYWMCWMCTDIWLGTPQDCEFCRSDSLVGWHHNVDYICRMGPKEILRNVLLVAPSLHGVCIVHGISCWRCALQHRILWTISVCFRSLPALLPIQKPRWSSFHKAANLRDLWADVSQAARYIGTFFVSLSWIFSL